MAKCSNPDETKRRILDKTKEYFLKYGYSKSNIDEIAESLRMSKKTLYQHFESKKALLECLIEENMKLIASRIEAIVNDQNLDFIEKQKRLLMSLGWVLGQLRVLIEDIQKNVPDIWAKIEEFRKKKFFQIFKKLILEAQEKSLVKKEIPADFILLVWFNVIQTVTDLKNLSNLPLTLPQAVETVFKMMFEGILEKDFQKMKQGS